MNSSLISDGMYSIVFVVWDWLTAVTWTHARGHGIETGWPFLFQSGLPAFIFTRLGPTSSTRQMTASRGSLPQPFIRWRTPLRYTKRPESSTAYHHRMKRICSGVKRHV